MSESTTPRLLAAAKEFNIGKDTLIEFLTGKGFSRDDLKPSARLTEEMYHALQAGFSSDKAAKAKSDQIEIPKGGVAEGKKKKEEEEISFRKESKKTAEKATEPAPEPVAEQPEEAPAPELVKAAVPEIDGPKVISKIDLDAIESSTRPKKTAKKKAEKSAPEAAAPAPVPSPDTPVAPDEPQVIENIRAEKLEGPKVLGKIELPADSDTRPKISISDKEKRKRKRIPVDKKGSEAAQHDNQTRASTDQPRGGQRPGGRAPLRLEKRGERSKKEDRIIDEKEIQEKLRETQAKLSGGGRGKSLKAKYRRAKREEAAEQMGEEGDDNIIQVTEFISASELANLMDVSATDVVAKCFSLGLMVSINQRLDAEVIELVAGEFGFSVEFIDMEKQAEMEEEEEEEDDTNLETRAPIVTIMGHVDHGKTSLLDYIRNANVVAGEAGGITQHIGAYEVTIADGRKITFLDTPGHEAFTAMRARGAKVTDIAVIVVAADDAVMPQTKEAISHAQAAGVPMIFAVNKIDKEGANPQKIYEQLSQMNLLVEEWGGKYQSQELSAKQGLNVDKLLEKILLEAELLDLKANPDKEASGSIIEASLDKGRGYVATILVQNGTLHQGDLLVSGQHYGRIKAMFNERNQRITEAGPSTPAVILGLNGAPQAGEKLKAYEDEAEAKEIASRRAQILREQSIRTKKHITLDEIGRRLALGNFKELNLIIKGDVDGSVEALTDSLQKLSTEEIAVNVIHRAVGQISEADVTLASASDAILIGFNVRPSMQAAKLAEQEGVEIKNYSIIYNAIEEIKSAMEGMLEPKITEKEVATVEIREVFKFDKATVAGCYVLEGRIKRDAKIRLFRDGVLIYPRQEGAFAELASLKRYKDDVKEVASNMECGLTLKNFADIQVGDNIVAFEEEEVKRTL
ncbi:MAG: translation initiation factor IF-2 [Chitinophagaceae bacterium]